LALRVASRRGLSLGAAARRNLCAPAVPLVDEVRSEIASMKERIAQKVDAGYTLEAFKAAQAAGTVDTSLLSQTMDFSDEARKLVVKLHTQTMQMQKEMESSSATSDALSAWESKLSPELVGKVKAFADAELASLSGDGAGNADVAALEAETMAAFNGSDGLFELASKEEKAAEAGMEQCIADMEKLEVDVQGVANVTIAEILEREPELRAEIEDEIKNNVWAP